MDEPTNADLMRELKSLRSQVERLTEKVHRVQKRHSDELVRLADFAEEMGISRQTIYRASDRGEIEIRDKHGFPKEDGDRTASFISRTEWQKGEPLDTETVRRRAGFYED